MQSQPPTHSAPASLIAASRAALALHDPTLAVAALVADSLLDDRLELPVGSDRLLVFGRRGLWVQVDLTRHDAGTRLHVRVDPAPVDPEASADPEAAPVDPAPVDLAPVDPAQAAGAAPDGSPLAPGSLTELVLEVVQPTGRVDVTLEDGEAVLPAVGPGLTSLVLRPAAPRERPEEPAERPRADGATHEPATHEPASAAHDEPVPTGRYRGVRTAWFTV